MAKKILRKGTKIYLLPKGKQFRGEQDLPMLRSLTVQVDTEIECEVPTVITQRSFVECDVPAPLQSMYDGYIVRAFDLT